MVSAQACLHRPRCPDARAADRSRAKAVANHPEQGWSLLCNGVVWFDDGGALLPEGTAVPPGSYRRGAQRGQDNRHLT